ncbi:MAG TPA: DUF4388 domain-containing protein [Chloroflexia bacterium]|nr:DUF4388 domain-containing protein [Chloroflexia bacterium]
MTLQGNLSDLPLVDLVQVLALQNRTGILSINHDYSQGQVCFSKSQIYSAFVHLQNPGSRPVTLQGEEAICELMDWPEGQFSFEISAGLPSARNVFVNWDYLILEQCRRHDEKARLQEPNQMVNVIPRLSPNPPSQAEITLDLEEWQVLLQINGNSTLDEISNRIQKPLNKIVELVQKLEKRNLIHLSPAWVEAEVKVLNHNDNPVIGNLPAPQAISFTPPAPRWSGPVLSNPLVAAQPVPVGAGVAAAKPKVQKGLLSNIMARIRGL